MNPNLQAELFSRYPHFFRKRINAKPPATAPVDLFDQYGICCGDGWFGLIDTVAAKYEALIQSLATRGVPNSEWPRAARVKEKFGRLHIQIENLSDVPEELIALKRAAEDLSEKTCVRCGRVVSTSDIQSSSECEQCDSRFTFHVARRSKL